MIPKQDRIQARTPAQLEQEYNFSKALKSADNSASKLGQQIQNLTQTLQQYMVTTNAKIEALSKAESSQTWFYSGVPTLANQPAVSWNTDELKQAHIGDIYYNEDDGTIYLFKGANGGYEWVACQGTSTETETYCVTFYSEDGVVVASYIIRQGDAINPPITDVAWKDSKGVEVSFPYTPTSDTDLYLSNEESTL